MKNGVLTEKNIKKLKALGIDPSKIKSEAEAQEVITKAQNAQANASIQVNSQQQSSVDVGKLRKDMIDLGKKIGVDVSSEKHINNIFDKLKNGVEEYTKAESTQANANIAVKNTKNDDVQIKAKKNEVKEKFANIKIRFDQFKTQENSMFAGQNMMAMLNRMSLGI